MEQDEYRITVAATSLINAHAPGSVLTEKCKPIDSYETIPHNQFDIQ